MAAPVYVKTIGGPATVNDIEVSLQQPQELAFVGQRVPVAVGVRQRGSLAAKVGLTLLAGRQAGRKLRRGAEARRSRRARLLRFAQAERAVSLRGPRRRFAGRGHHREQYRAVAVARGRSAGPRAVVGGQAVLGHEVSGADPVGRRVDRADQRRATGRGAAVAAENPPPYAVGRKARLANNGPSSAMRASSSPMPTRSARIRS